MVKQDLNIILERNAFIPFFHWICELSRQATCHDRTLFNVMFDCVCGLSRYHLMTVMIHCDGRRNYWTHICDSQKESCLFKLKTRFNYETIICPAVFSPKGAKAFKGTIFVESHDANIYFTSRLNSIPANDFFLRSNDT